MTKKMRLTPLSSAVGVGFAVGLTGVPLAQAADNPFGLTELSKGYMVAQAGTEGDTETKSSEGKCAEGKCSADMKAGGADMKMSEGKCAEGKCGANMMDGDTMKMPEGRCGAMDMQGMVMNENTDRLPPGCSAISEERQITVKGGRKHARYNGQTFGFSEHEWHVKPCSKITVTFINEDDVRHQWMVHQLPKYIYPQGMFHMEVNGSGEKTGTFIVPAEDKTILVHCDIAQHMEKGMKAQLVIGKGGKDLPAIPGISGPIKPDRYR